jgi:hypothetical protein
MFVRNLKRTLKTCRDALKGRHHHSTCLQPSMTPRTASSHWRCSIRPAHWRTYNLGVQSKAQSSVMQCMCKAGQHVTCVAEIVHASMDAVAQTHEGPHEMSVRTDHAEPDSKGRRHCPPAERPTGYKHRCATEQRMDIQRMGSLQASLLPTLAS